MILADDCRVTNTDTQWFRSHINRTFTFTYVKCIRIMYAYIMESKYYQS